MTLYNPLNAKQGTVTIFHPESLADLLDYSVTWHIDPIVVGNLVLKYCFGDAFRIREDSRIVQIAAETPDTAIYGIGYIEDYHSKRQRILEDYITEFFHTLLCEFSRQNQKSMLTKNMQIIKFCSSGVYIYHE